MMKLKLAVYTIPPPPPPLVHKGCQKINTKAINTNHNHVWTKYLMQKIENNTRPLASFSWKKDDKLNFCARYKYQVELPSRVITKISFRK